MALRDTLTRIAPLLRSGAIRTGRHLLLGPAPNLEGDRHVEYSFVSNFMPRGPGQALDVGCGEGWLGLLAARAGFSVTAVDLTPRRSPTAHQGLTHVAGDLFGILDHLRAPLDLVIACSTIEHFGLTGRYGPEKGMDDDLRAMSLLRAHIANHGRLLLTVPVGQDDVVMPWHRIYGVVRLPRLLDGYQLEVEEFWTKEATNIWAQCSRERALRTRASRRFYALGLFLLRPWQE